MTAEPLSMIGPPEPWSVPFESDSSRRRPNSENTIVITFCSTPRVARSALNAASARESVVELRILPGELVAVRVEAAPVDRDDARAEAGREQRGRELQLLREAAVGRVAGAGERRR